MAAEKVVDFRKMSFEETVERMMEIFEVSRAQAEERAAIIHGRIKSDVVEGEDEPRASGR